jgi:amino acid adenylation domain-containing protein
MINKKNDNLAIISMACRLPGADNISELWANLAHGTSSIKEIPADRWSLNQFYSSRPGYIGKSNTRKGTFLNDVKSFDPAFFGINPEDAYVMDPQQRILIELAYEAIHSTKYVSADLAGRKVGVFLGVTKSDYRDYVQEALIRLQLKQSTAVIGVLQNMIAARISHTFDFQGPALTIDTACSSSLVALHLASESIISGSCEMALVGGINLNLVPGPYLGMAAAGALSSAENYHVFDQHSSGFFMGEGGGIIIIKKLSEAIRENDNILGVIMGSAINNDGKGISPMAPRPGTQQAVLRDAYARAGLETAQVDYIEAHGTGTFLGDAIEAQTLVKVFQGNKKEVFLGSIKPNIGHLLSGAGIASIIKVLLCFQNRKIPPLINYQSPRTELGLEDSGFILNSVLTDFWEDKEMVAGINGFGFGGTNAHVILQEYQPQKEIFRQYLPPYNKSEYWLNIDFSIDQRFDQVQAVPETEKMFTPEWQEQNKPDENYLSPGIISLSSDFYSDFTAKLSEVSGNISQLASDKIGENLTSFDSVDLLILFPRSYQYLLKLLQEIKRDSDKINRLFIVTEQAVLLPEDQSSENSVRFLTAGLAAVAAGELNHIPVKHIDLDKNDNDILKIEQIMIELAADSSDIVVYRNNKRYCRVLSPFTLNRSDKAADLLREKNRIKKDGVYLVTGASSGIGLETARFIAGQVSLRLVLIGRRPQSEIKNWPQIIGEITANGSTADYFSIDVANPEEMELLFNRIASEYGQLNGVIHAAGVVSPGSFSEKTADSFENTLKPKVIGIELLNRYIDTFKFKPDFFIAFSSISAVLPGLSGSISDYAVANYFLEQYCLLQQKKEKPFQVISWGPWSEHGMVAGNKLFLQKISEKGIGALETEKGLKIFQTIVNKQYPHVIVYGTVGASSLKGFPVQYGSITAFPSVTGTHLAIPENESALYDEETLQHLLIEIIRDELGTSAIKEIAIDDNLLDLGIDSLTAMEIIARLGNSGFKNLPFELIFENQTVKEIASYLLLTSGKTETKSQNIFSSSPLSLREEAGERVLSPQQEAFFKAHTISPAPNFSYMRQSIEKNLDIDLLDQAVKLLLEKHPILKSNFFVQKQEGQLILRQKIKPAGFYDSSPIIEKIELNAPLPVIEDTFANKRFDLEHDLLIKVGIAADEDITHLLILVHHIVFDGYSMHLLVRDLWDTYLKLVQGISPELNTLQTDYSAYINYINNLRNGSRFKESLEWWKNHLQSFPRTVNSKIKELLSFEPENSNASLFKIPVGTLKQLNNFVQENKISSQFLLLAIYSQTLSQWFNTEGVTVNLAISGRQHQVRDISSIIGCFADTLPIHIRISPSEEDILAKAHQLRNEWNQGKQYHNITSSDLVPLLKAEKMVPGPFAFSYVPLNKDWSRALPFNVTGTNARGFNSNTRFTLQIWEDLKGLNFTLNYPEKMISREEAGIFGKFFLENIMKTIGKGVKTEQPVENLIIRRFSSNAAQYPDKTAIVFNEHAFSYKEIEQQSSLIAGVLQQREVKSVAVIGSPSARTAITLLAILNTGATYTPVDKDYPFYRVEEMLAISKADLVIITEDYQDIQKLKNIPVIEFSELITPEPSRPLSVVETEREVMVESFPLNKSAIFSDLLRVKEVRGESIAYIIFTSGSTGKPKGVPVTYRALFNYLEWCIDTFAYNQGDNVIQTASICFDASLRQMLAPLMTGGTLYPVTADIKIDIKALWHFIREKQITVWSSVPSLWEKLLTFAEKQINKNLPALRMVKLGGEALSAENVRRWQNIYGTFKPLVNLYGPTETTINATYHIIDYPVTEDINAIPIGKALPYLKCEINSQDYSGEKGELWISGIGVTPGYLNNDNLTVNKFFTDEQGIVFYKTGDIVSLHKSLYYFHGRTDRQIKIRGFRVEPAEIEQTLIEHPLVLSAVVEPVYSGGIQQVIAFIYLRYSFISLNEIRDYLAKELPEYMMPNKIEVIEHLPLLPNGKVDRKTILEGYIPALTHNVGLPSAGTFEEDPETIIGETWKKVLKTVTVTDKSDFFEEGGDSLLLMQLFMELEEFFPALPKIAAFYKQAKFSKLVRMIGEINQIPAYEPDKNLVQRFPLSPAQTGFYLSHKYLGGDNSYWSSSFYLRGNIDSDLWLKSLEILQARHQMLNVRLVSESPPYFEHLENSPLIFEYDGLSTRNNASEWANHPEFDLEKGYPLIKHYLVKLSKDEYIWKIRAHHILADGLSSLIFGKEQLKVYNSLSRNEKVSLPELKSRFSDFTFYIQEQQKQNSYKDNLYWSKVFEDPYNEPDLPVTDENARTFLFRKELLNNEIWRQITRKARQTGSTPFIILLTAFYSALARHTSHNDLIIGVAHHGRDYPLPDIQNIFGCFARALPLRIDNGPEVTAEQVNRVFKESLGHSLNPTEIIKIIKPGTKLKNLLGTGFFFSYLDFSALAAENDNSGVQVDWDKSASLFQPGNNDTLIFLTAKKLNDNMELHFSFNRKNFNETIAAEIQALFLEELKKSIALSGSIQITDKALNLKETGPVNSALIGYLPSLKSLPLNREGAEKIREKLFNGKKALLCETIKTELGNTGTILLPLFAEEITSSSGKQVLEYIKEAVKLADSIGIKSVSLAGMLPSVTGYATKVSGPAGLKATTGHSCTVAAVVKTFQQVIETTGLNLKESTLAFVGLGSIGKAVLYTLLSMNIRPEKIVLCDLFTSFQHLENIEKYICRNLNFEGTVIRAISSGNLPEQVYGANIMVSAVSRPEVINIDMLKPGTILIDDSFPYCFDTGAAISRMEKQEDILVTGGGLLKTEFSERLIYFPEENKYISNLLTASFIPGTLASCQFEALLLASEPDLPVTKGLADYQQAEKYLTVLDKRKIKPAPFHIGKYIVDHELAEKLLFYLPQR